MSTENLTRKRIFFGQTQTTAAGQQGMSFATVAKYKTWENMEKSPPEIGDINRQKTINITVFGFGYYKWRERGCA